MNGAHVPRPRAEQDDSAAPPTEAEVRTIIQTISDVSSGPTSLPRSPSPPRDADHLDIGAYWDLSTMAPLNAVSAVST